MKKRQQKESGHFLLLQNKTQKKRKQKRQKRGCTYQVQPLLYNNIRRNVYEKAVVYL